MAVHAHAAVDHEAAVRHQQGREDLEAALQAEVEDLADLALAFGQFGKCAVAGDAAVGAHQQEPPHHRVDRCDAADGAVAEVGADGLAAVGLLGDLEAGGQDAGGEVLAGQLLVLVLQAHDHVQEVAHDLGAAIEQEDECRGHEIAHEAVVVIGRRDARVAGGYRAHGLVLKVDQGTLEQLGGILDRIRQDSCRGLFSF